jgi:hypothetical protein
VESNDIENTKMSLREKFLPGDSKGKGKAIPVTGHEGP